jgi:hypothetical protein
MRTRSFTAALVLVLAACGTNPPDVPPETKSLFPLAVDGVRPRVVDAGAKPEKTQTVTGTTTFAGSPAFTMETQSGLKRVLSVQLLQGTKLVRASEDTYSGQIAIERLRFTPPALRVDTGVTTLGATYQEQHAEELIDDQGNVIPPSLTKVETFTIEAVDEAVTVPAGSYRAVRVRRDTQGGPSKTFWYVSGIGKIREVGGQTEELKSYTVKEETAQ